MEKTQPLFNRHLWANCSHATNPWSLFSQQQRRPTLPLTQQTMASSQSSLGGLPDYSQHKARVRRHDSFVKRTSLNTSQSSLELEELNNVSSRTPMTVEEFRESLLRDDDGDEDIKFVLRRTRKRWRDGSSHHGSHHSHSVTRGNYNVQHDENGNYTVQVKQEPRRSITGKSKSLVRQGSNDNLGASAEEISAYGYAQQSPRRGGRRSFVRNDSPAVLEEGPTPPSMPIHGLLEVSEGERSASDISFSIDLPRRAEQKPGEKVTTVGERNQLSSPSQRSGVTEIVPSDTSASDQSMTTYGSSSDTSLSLSMASSCASGGLSKSGRGKSVHGNPTMPAHLQSSCPSIDEDMTDEGEAVQQTPRERPIFSGFGTGGYVRTFPTRSPSDSDESFSSFAHKYSRFSQPGVDTKPQRNDHDSTMDFNESFSSFASFADDDLGTVTSAQKRRGLLDGSEPSEEESEEDLSIGEQSPGSVIVDLTSVSTSLNSQSLSPRSSSKTSLSRERRSVVPPSDAKDTRSRKEDKRASRSRRETADGCSVESAVSKVSGTSWLSRHSNAKSTNSRFSRLEEYLNRNESSEANNNNNNNSKQSLERKDDLSTTSSLTMGTFRTNETKDSDLKKLSEVADSQEEPNPVSDDGQHRGSSSKRINSNPFLSADRKKNIPVPNTFDSAKKSSKAWRPPTTSPSSPFKSPPLKAVEEKGEPTSPTKTPRTSPGKLSANRVTASKDTVADGADVSPSHPGVATTKSEQSLPKCPPHGKSPSKGASSDAVLDGLSKITCAPLSSPMKSVKGTVTLRAEQSTIHPGETTNTTKVVSKLLTTKALSSPPLKIEPEEAVGPVSKATSSTILFKKPANSVKKGINLFNPSAASTGPKKKKEHVNPAENDTPGQDVASTVDDASKSAKGHVQTKPSKVQSYLRRLKEMDASGATNDPTKVCPSRVMRQTKSAPQASKAAEAPPQSPGGKKGDWNGAINGITGSPGPLSGPSTRPNQVKSTGTTPLSSNKDSKPGNNEPSKPPPRCPATSRPTIGQFLESNKNREEEEVFKEPVPSPWRPSTQCGRSRQRMGDSNSRASSVASSKCSARAEALSMFQPHRQVSGDAVPHSPTRASQSPGDGMKSKLSLVEQRKLMFQAGNQTNVSKQQSTRSFPEVMRQSSMASVAQAVPRQTSMSCISEQPSSIQDPMASLGLPTAAGISSRVKAWNNDKVVRAGN